MAYTTSQLDTIVSNLESALANGYAEVVFENRRLVYRSGADIRAAIAYFKSLYASATDAPANPTPKTRTFLFYGGKGFGV